MLLAIVGIFGQFNNYLLSISAAVQIALRTPNTTVVVPNCMIMVGNFRCLDDIFDWTIAVSEFPLKIVSSSHFNSLNCNNSMRVQCHDASQLFTAFWGGPPFEALIYSLRPPPIVTLQLQTNSLFRFPYAAIHSRNLDGQCYTFVQRFLHPTNHALGNRSCALPIQLIENWRRDVGAQSMPLVLVSDNQRPAHDATIVHLGAIHANALFDVACARNSSMRLSLDFWVLVRSTHFLSAPMSTFSGNVCRMRTALNMTPCRSMLDA
jgi:hypothetical protein